MLSHVQRHTPATLFFTLLAHTSFAAPAPDWQPLFNGKDLNGWSARYASKAPEGAPAPAKLFTVENGQIHVYRDAAAGSAQPFASLITDAEYRDYRLSLEYRWGEKKFAPRLNVVRDSGLLYHVHGDRPNTWPASAEAQLQEGIQIRPLTNDDDMPPEPKVTEVWFPVPSKVTPGATAGAPPSDAIVLFDGKNLNAWKSVKGGDAKWNVDNGQLVIAPGTGDIQTRQNFADVQLHVEWRAPKLPPDKVNQDRGNSGVFLQDRYEVQVLDNFENTTYVNGMVGSIYKQYAPLVNATLPAEAWQVYDIIFTAPRFAADGSLISPARMTVLHNGVLVQNNASLKGATVYIGAPSYSPHGELPIRLQDHSHEVRFRNIWLRRL